MRFTLTIAFVDLDPVGAEQLSSYCAALGDDDPRTVTSPAELDPSLDVRITAVGSKWDGGSQRPLVAEQLVAGEQVRVRVDELAAGGARLNIDWPVTLPLGELIQLQLQANELSHVRSWARVEAARARRATPMRSLAASLTPDRTLTPDRRTSDPAPPSPGAARAA